MSEEKTFQGKVTALSSQGMGILRNDHLVTFIPFTAPGDTILYQVIEQKKNFAQGKLLQILNPSASRVLPLCRYYGSCGGCQLQHLSYEAQLDNKRQIIADSLRRIGNFENPPVPAVSPTRYPWAYRRHITLRIQHLHNRPEVGYIGIDNRSFVPVEHCPIFIPEDNSAIQEVQKFLQDMAIDQTGTAILFKTEQGQMILSLNFEKATKITSEIIDNFLKQRWIGLILHHGKKVDRWGTCQSIITIDSLQCICTPDVFTQNNPEQSLKIYHQISELAFSSVKKKILDLYCGIGISSLLLAKQGHDVIGIEYNAESIGLSQENAKRNGLSSTRFIPGDVEKVMRQLKREKFDLIIANPPRTGLSQQVIESLLYFAPNEIIYVSCMPATLARDLKRLCANDYKISLIQPYDMFPQTYHVETLVRLEKLLP